MNENIESKDITLMRNMEKLRRDIKALSKFNFISDNDKLNENLEIVLMLLCEDFKSFNFHIESAMNLVATMKQKEVRDEDPDYLTKNWIYKTGVRSNLNGDLPLGKDDTSFCSYCMRETLMEYIIKPERDYLVRYLIEGDETEVKYLIWEEYDFMNDTFVEKGQIKLDE